MYSSFVIPKSAGALAAAEAPQRAAVIASSIAFAVREQKAAAAQWLRNHDRALGELGEQAATPLSIILDNVRSAPNVGNIFRMAEAARVTHLYTCGITPSPPESKLLKTAMGAAAYVRHSHRPNTLEVVRELQAAGVAVWAVETTERSVTLWEAQLTQPCALVFGNELIGVDVDVCDACDGMVRVPMLGVKNSLNVATCASVLVWEALRQWRED